MPSSTPGCSTNASDERVNGPAQALPARVAAERQLERVRGLHPGEARRPHDPDEARQVRRPPGEGVDPVEVGHRLALAEAEPLDHVDDHGTSGAYAADVLDRRDRVLQVEQEVA